MEAQKKEVEEAKHALKTHRAWSHRALSAAKEEAQSLREGQEMFQEKAAKFEEDNDILKRQLTVSDVQRRQAQHSVTALEAQVAAVSMPIPIDAVERPMTVSSRRSSTSSVSSATGIPRPRSAQILARNPPKIPN